jgi:HEPN domain-containing protein
MGKDDLLRQWLDKGNNELRSAEYLATMHHPTPDEVICYLCQQAAEKYLKGFLFLNDMEPPKTHDLNELLNMCVEKNGGFSVLSARMSVLKTYAIMPRYPNELAITKENMDTAIQYSKETREFVLGVIKEMVKDGN